MYVSKRDLGEGYIVAIGVVLAAVLSGQLVREGMPGSFWFVAASLSFVVLIGAVYWLQRLDLTSEQVWHISNCSALGLGLGTTGLFVAEVATTAELVTSGETAVLGTTLGVTAATGTLGGVVFTLYRSNRNLRGQNAVLHRVLRHNLRNDMSVVLCLLDDIESSADGETAATANQAREKIQSFVRLTDSVRQANVGLTDAAKTRQTRDVTTIVESRVSELEAEHPDLTVEMDLPEEALVSVGETFSLVVDNVVESTLSGAADSPHLSIRIERTRETVTIVFDDASGAMPDADFSAVASGSETALDHGLGVELWLVEWLVDANDGDVTFETVEDSNRVRIELGRARPTWLN